MNGRIAVSPLPVAGEMLARDVIVFSSRNPRRVQPLAATAHVLRLLGHLLRAGSVRAGRSNRLGSRLNRNARTAKIAS